MTNFINVLFCGRGGGKGARVVVEIEMRDEENSRTGNHNLEGKTKVKLTNENS